tara:strand:+ start:428 stop:964 length:537 start_codon:yes stop_codon:yes gene_type:complete
LDARTQLVGAHLCTERRDLGAITRGLGFFPLWDDARPGGVAVLCVELAAELITTWECAAAHHGKAVEHLAAVIIFEIARLVTIITDDATQIGACGLDTSAAARDLCVPTFAEADFYVHGVGVGALTEKSRAKISSVFIAGRAFDDGLSCGVVFAAIWRRNVVLWAYALTAHVPCSVGI